MQLAIYWKWIEAPNNVDLIMIAPKGPGSKVRETYLDNFGTPQLLQSNKTLQEKLGIEHWELQKQSEVQELD